MSKIQFKGYVSVVCSPNTKQGYQLSLKKPPESGISPRVKPNPVLS